jgi:DEAD/DEAH box helicase domain-containing protein
MREIVFDIETKNTFHDVGNRDPAALDLSVIGIYDSETDSYESYLEDGLSELWPRIEHTDVLVGFNSDYFDIPLLNKYYPGDLTRIKSIDLLSAVKKSLGRRLKLDTLAQGTLGEGKSGHGLEAVSWWQNGEIEKVRKYCLDDVRITRELYEYAKKNKILKYKDLTVFKEIPINTSDWGINESSNMTHTLPF